MRILFVIILVFLCNCSDVSSDVKEGVRIVSLSPGITASLIDMGFAQKIVGQSAFCEEITNSVPVVGDIYAIDYERLLRLHPSHVFIQNRSSGIDSHLVELSESGAFTLRSWDLDSISDIQTLASDLASILAVKESPIEVKLDGISISDGPTLLMTSGSQQQVGLCFGKGTYLDDMFIAMGGVNALETNGWSLLSLEDIARLSPARIVIVSDVKPTQHTPIDSLGIPVTFFVHKDVLVPSTRIVEVAQSLQQSLAESQ